MKQTKKDFVSRCNEVISKYNPRLGTWGEHYVNTRFGEMVVHPFDGKFPWIAMQFRGKTPPFGIWGSFNPYSWKWNIHFSGGNKKETLDMSIAELVYRLEWATTNCVDFSSNPKLLTP